ncbi:hypothetical protein PFISCL1PPCAC_8154, partial [Pristionchus fissidentatus]
FFAWQSLYGQTPNRFLIIYSCLLLSSHGLEDLAADSGGQRVDEGGDLLLLSLESSGLSGDLGELGVSGAGGGREAGDGRGVGGLLLLLVLLDFSLEVGVGELDGARLSGCPLVDGGVHLHLGLVSVGLEHGEEGLLGGGIGLNIEGRDVVLLSSLLGVDCDGNEGEEGKPGEHG